MYFNLPHQICKIDCALYLVQNCTWHPLSRLFGLRRKWNYFVNHTAENNCFWFLKALTPTNRQRRLIYNRSLFLCNRDRINYDVLKKGIGRGKDMKLETGSPISAFFSSSFQAIAVQCALCTRPTLLYCTTPKKYFARQKVSDHS